MELKKQVVFVNLFLLVLGMTTTIFAGFDRIPSVLKEAANLNDDDYYPCCDNCVCSTMTSGTCQCKDVVDACHVSCGNCICTSPKHCGCHDELESCDPPCAY
ncbi:hypothetical protein HN51_041175 [Arachis hypogaea]|nr:Bowman-Birk type proteinase inhibitor [Arachis hypogaea]